MSEEESLAQKTLWMLECKHGDGYYQLIPLYARSEEEANQRTEDYIREDDWALTVVSLRAFPNGFRIYRSSLPGKV